MSQAENNIYQTRSMQMIEQSRQGDMDDDFYEHLLESEQPTQDAYAAIMAAHNGLPLGVEHKHKDREAWAFVLPDASQPGAYRVQYFDEHGFTSHQSEQSLEEVVEEMARGGYTVEDRDALPRVSATETWSKGMAQLEWLQKLNNSEISYSEYLERIS